MHCLTLKGIVILGASSDPGKLGYAVARNLVEGGYPGEVHFVNPKGGILFGRPLHQSVLDVPDPVDLAVVIVPAQAAPQAIKDIGRRGIHAAIVTSVDSERVGKKAQLSRKKSLRYARNSKSG